MNSRAAGPSRALITGASGFVGSRLARRLIGLGWEVHAIARSAVAEAAISAVAGSNVRIHRVNDTTERMIEVIHIARPDTVFHLASLVLAQHEPSDMEDLFRSNILLGAQLAEAMVHSGARNLINTGTYWQHYQDAAYDPVNLYAATKQALEAILDYYAVAQGLRISTLILFDTYGPGDTRKKLVQLLERTANERATLDMSPGRQQIDLVHVEDVIQAYVRAAELLPVQETPHQRYGVSSGQPISLRQLVTLFEAATGKKLSIRWGARPYRHREVMRPWSGYHTLPGWQPKITLEAGLATLADLEKRPEST